MAIRILVLVFSLAAAFPLVSHAQSSCEDTVRKDPKLAKAFKKKFASSQEIFIAARGNDYQGLMSHIYQATQICSTSSTSTYSYDALSSWESTSYCETSKNKARASLEAFYQGAIAAVCSDN